MGEGRNSYSKTDPDATFMGMKEDHMGNGQLKPGYNVQIAVNSEYIMGLEVFSDRSDAKTFRPMMGKLAEKHGKPYEETVADFFGPHHLPCLVYVVGACPADKGNPCQNLYVRI